MKIACCVWALTLPEKDIFDHMNTLGFEWVDIQPNMLRTETLRAHVQTLGLKVSCVGASFGIPDDASLDHVDDDKRQRAIDHVRDSIDHAHELGATCAYVVPTMDASADALERYAGSLREIGDHAESLHIKIAIEHFPGRALPTAQDTLDFIEQVGHDNLYLLLDSGHLQMSDEDAPTVIRNAKDRLAYVHLDDNDGEGDLHWSLLDGVMTRESLKALLDTLDEVGYDGAISLELSPKLSDPLKALRDSLDIVQKL